VGRTAALPPTAPEGGDPCSAAPRPPAFGLTALAGRLDRGQDANATAAQVQAYCRGLREQVEQAADSSSLPETVILTTLTATTAGSSDIRWHVAVVERTNNPAEKFFSHAKRRLRRRLGHLGRAIRDQPAQAALAANLLDPNYVKVVCDTLEYLPSAFAELEPSGAARARPNLRPSQPRTVPCRRFGASRT